jgi:hypothetical protein
MLSMLLLVLGAAAPPSEPVTVKTPVTTFARDWDLAVVDGTIWRRPRPPEGQRTPPVGAWELLPPAGLPAPRGRIDALKELVPAVRIFATPARIAKLSADGENIIAVDEGGRVYYAKLATLDWDDVWGPPGLSAPLVLPPSHKGFSISHRKQPYTDIDGNTHRAGPGVTTLYVLTADDRIVYADPWLPPTLDHEICPPERGRLRLVALSASASTIAVMDDAGRVFTRLADFDTIGNNPALPYTWQRGRRAGLLENVRSLPPEDWRLQPRIPGRHTTSLTIFQTGSGNAARRLRVEGEGGTWEKDIDDRSWGFVRAPGRVRWPTAVFIDNDKPTVKPPRGVDLEGAVRDLRVKIEDFSLACPGARVRVSRGAEEVELTLWHTDRLVELERSERDVAGALLRRGPLRGALGQELAALFGGDKVGDEVGDRGGERAAEVDVAVKGTRVRIAPRGPGPRRFRLELHPKKDGAR